MTIMIIIPNFDLAGAEMMATNLAIGLKRTGHRVKIISLFNKHTVLTDKLEREKISITYLNKKLGFDPLIIFKLKEEFDREKPDIIHTHLDCLKYTTIAASLSHVKGRVHTVHNLADKEASGIVRVINRIIYKYFKVRPVALSLEVKRSIVDLYKINESMVSMVYNGIDLEECKRKKIYNTDRVVFVNVARFSEQKNHRMLIKAFYEFEKKNSNTELWLIGHGSLFDEMKELVQSLGIEEKVKFWGLRDDVKEIIVNADVFVLPSLYEGVPISIIEAMATGLPIIATNVGGVPSMIEDEGILINCNEKELENAMEKMMMSKEREYYGSKAKKRANELFSLQSMTESYLKIYKNVLGK